MQDGRTRGRAIGRGVVVLVAVAVATWAVLARSASGLGHAGAGAAPTVPPLVVSDGGVPLFDGTDVRVGVPRAACAEVRFRPTDPRPVVVVLGADVQGTLADLLTVTVEEGRGGADGDCRGFEPAVVTFRGTLAELGATSAGAWRPEGRDRRGYRITTRLRRAAVGRADADLHWTARAA